MLTVTVAEEQARAAPPESGFAGSRLNSVCTDRVDPVTVTLVAKRGEALSGSIRFSIHADGTAFLWPPVMTTADDRAAVDALLDSVSCRFDAAGAWLGQCLIGRAAGSSQRMLERHGFQVIADVANLRHEPGVAAPGRGDQSLEFRRLDVEYNLEGAAALLESTWIDSLDCPALAGCRTAHEALTCHRLTGCHDPELWSIARLNGRDAGLLLLTDWPDEREFEVVYMGVVPQERGKRIGRRLMEHAFQQTAEHSRRALRLAVDDANTHAMRIYNDLGFECTQRLRLLGRLHPDRRPTESGN